MKTKIFDFQIQDKNKPNSYDVVTYCYKTDLYKIRASGYEKEMTPFLEEALLSCDAEKMS